MFTKCLRAISLNFSKDCDTLGTLCRKVGDRSLKKWLWYLLPCVLLAAALPFLFLRPRPVLVCDRDSLSPTEFSYYYWSEFFYFQEAYGEYLADAVDLSAPLDQQAYSQEQTWQDYLVEESLSVAADTLAMAFAAEDAGFSLPPDYEEALEATRSSFLVRSDGDLEGYLKASYGRKANSKSFRLYLYRSHLAAAYAESLYTALDPSEEDVTAYYADHAGEYLDNYGLTKEDDWAPQAREDLIQELAQAQLAELRAACSFRVNYDAVKIVPPVGLYEEK